MKKLKFYVCPTCGNILDIHRRGGDFVLRQKACPAQGKVLG
ncbi:MAG: hypothetical protein AB7D36_02400 [Oscillospiraceae bacterium]